MGLKIYSYLSFQKNQQHFTRFSPTNLDRRFLYRSSPDLSKCRELGMTRDMAVDYRETHVWQGGQCTYSTQVTDVWAVGTCMYPR